MNMLYIVVLSLSLSACWGGPKTIKPPADNERKIHIDERLLVPCKGLSLLMENPQPSDVVKQHGKDVADYRECAKGKQDLIEVVRKAFVQN